MNDQFNREIGPGLRFVECTAVELLDSSFSIAEKISVGTKILPLIVQSRVDNAEKRV